MSALLPCPSTSPGAASGRAVIRSKIEIATQRQHEQAMLLAQVDKSREPAINKTCAFNCAAPAMPSSVERTHHVDVPLAIVQGELVITILCTLLI